MLLYNVEHLCPQFTILPSIIIKYNYKTYWRTESLLDNDAALILSRLLAEDYQNQDVVPEEDYSYYQYIQPAIKPPAGYDLESYQNTQDAAPHQENLKFPELLPHQKQFAVNPSSAVFDEKNPDFLQYRLEAMERTNHPELKSSDLDFQKQLLEAMDSRREEDLGSGPDKRGMLGEPRAMPVISDNLDEDISEDFFFTCKYHGSINYGKNICLMSYSQQ